MRIHSVTAHAFGPLKQDTLTFADGMTVVVGDNESAKSSWHAAIFAAICGRRRGKGKPRADEQSFIDAHKPWDQEEWLVTAQLVLDDDRNIEMRQDLAGKVDCHAKDLSLGRDVSSEIMNDGTPDASKWLGLDRSSFVATACVEQGQMLRVRQDAAGLQEQLQRAAATAGTAATAATAIDRIDEYLKERVGRDQANSTKPLRNAHLNVQRAERVLEERTKAHDEYVSRVARLEQLREEAAAATATVRAYEAADAIQSATTLQERLRRARELYLKYGDKAPLSALDDDALAQEASEALTGWRSRPEEPTLPTPSSAEIKHEIDGLPASPEGDTEPHPSVLRSIDRLKGASAQLQLHDRSRPLGDVSAPQVAADDEELLDLARTLETPAPFVPSELLAREAEARKAVTNAQGRRKPSVALMTVGVAVAVIGILLFATASHAIGTAVTVVGTILIFAGALLKGSGASASASRKLAEVQGLLQAAQTQVAEATRLREHASARCAQLGIPATSAALRTIPVSRARAAAHAHDVEEWTKEHADLQGEVAAAASELSDALASRCHKATGHEVLALLDLADKYQKACRDNAAQAAQAARRADLMRQFSAAQAAELRCADDQLTRASAAELVLAVASRCENACDTAEDAAAALQTWMEERKDRLAELETEQHERAELQAILANKSLVELEESSRAATTRADELRAAADSTALASVVSASAAEKLPALRQAASQAETRAATEKGELRLFATNIGSIAEAEEDLTKAQIELKRVEELKATLELTRKLLEDAQTRVHRDIAPLLADTLRQWLPMVTDSRYTDVMVDPECLLVQVCGESRRWRKADLLSYGTAEQVYLLLRVALADHLTKGHDTCPLLLDDVTVHADAARTRGILDLLLQVSTDRQVVVFTQEEQVAAWAREKLTGPAHAIHELTSIAIA